VVIVLAQVQAVVQVLEAVQVKVAQVNQVRVRVQASQAQVAHHL
jgi:hypothetical protein